MKSGKPPAGMNRDRAYWEPPHAGIARIEGRVEEMPLDDVEAERPPRPKGTRTLVLERLRHHRVRTGIAAGCLVLTVAAVTVGPLSHQGTSGPHSSPSPVGANAPGSSAIPGSGGAQSSPTPWAQSTTTLPPIVFLPGPNSGSAATITPPPDETAQPSYTSGWPLVLEDWQDQAEPTTWLIGPDGSLFVDGFQPFDKAGKARSGWQLPDGKRIVPSAIGADGTAYVLVQPNAYDDPLPIYAFAADGELRSGWPFEVKSHYGDTVLVAGPSGTLYVIGHGSTTTVTVLSSQAKKLASWSFGSPGQSCGEVVTDNGEIFLAYGPSASSTSCAIRVYSQSGKLESAAPAAAWNGIEAGTNGTIVAWGYDTQPYSADAVAQTRVAIIGSNGLPAAGWPVAIEGQASHPAFSSDNHILMTVLGLGLSPSKVVAFDLDGTAVSGSWPVPLPAGYGPIVDARGSPLPPVAGLDGAEYVAAVNRSLTGYVLGLDSSGKAMPGWPYKLPQALSNGNGFTSRGMSSTGGDVNPGPLFAKSGGSGQLYLLLVDRVVALKPTGQVAPGWPVSADGKHKAPEWVWAMTTPDGGIIAATIQEAEGLGATTSVNNWLVFRWTASGAVSK